MAETLEVLPRLISDVFNGRLTISEAEFCDVVGISRTTVWSLRKRGKISHYREGKTVLYGPDHVLNYLRRREVPARKDKR